MAEYEAFSSGKQQFPRFFWTTLPQGLGMSELHPSPPSQWNHIASGNARNKFGDACGFALATAPLWNQKMIVLQVPFYNGKPHLPMNQRQHLLLEEENLTRLATGLGAHEEHR